MKIRSLTKANINKLGIELRPDLDFTDDGNRFRGFSYKGLPLTQCVYKGTAYLAIRVDYLENEFEYSEWMKTPEYKLAEEFNGVSEIDTDKLLENLEKIITKVQELTEAAKAEELDIEAIKEKMLKEIKEASNIIENFKMNYIWYEADEYELKTATKYLKMAEKDLRQATTIYADLAGMEHRRQRHYAVRAKSSDYIVISTEGYFLKELVKRI